MKNTPTQLVEAARGHVAQQDVEAVLYARVSSKEQEQGYSIPAQQELLRASAAERNVVVIPKEIAKWEGVQELPCQREL